MTTIKNKIDRSLLQYQNIKKKNGQGYAIYCALYDLINRVTPFSVYRITLMSPGDIPKAIRNMPQRFIWRRLDADECVYYANDPQNDMSESFVLDALAHGEECYGLFDGDQLASYAWYSGSPSHVRRELYFIFEENYKYRHKAFTYPKYRGLRLNAFNKANACLLYSEKGCRGLLSIVEAHNLSSLKSNERSGAKIIGDIAVILIGSKYRVYGDLASRAYGCKLKQIEHKA